MCRPLELSILKGGRETAFLGKEQIQKELHMDDWLQIYRKLCKLCLDFPMKSCDSDVIASSLNCLSICHSILRRH